MTPPGPRATLVEIAAWVSSALGARGIHPVLVGGSAVGAHTRNRYQSLDVDLATVAPGREIAEAMRELGFRRAGRVWRHPRFRPTVDFVAGPPAAGGLVFESFMTLRTRFGRISVVTPTQAAMDRLAAFYHWDDRQGLDQAVLVARTHRLDLKAIAAWSAGEGMAAKLEVFRRALAARPRGPRAGRRRG